MRYKLDGDDKWMEMLLGLQSEFWHQTIATEQVKTYISESTGFELDRNFYMDVDEEQSPPVTAPSASSLLRNGYTLEHFQVWPRILLQVPQSRGNLLGAGQLAAVILWQLRHDGVTGHADGTGGGS